MNVSEEHQRRMASVEAHLTVSGRIWPYSKLRKVGKLQRSTVYYKILLKLQALRLGDKLSSFYGKAAARSNNFDLQQPCKVGFLLWASDGGISVSQG